MGTLDLTARVNHPPLRHPPFEFVDGIREGNPSSPDTACVGLSSDVCSVASLVPCWLVSFACATAMAATVWLCGL
jgi:hypothetical protein